MLLLQRHRWLAANLSPAGVVSGVFTSVMECHIANQDMATKRVIERVSFSVIHGGANVFYKPC